MGEMRMFVSYSREDKEVAERIVGLLTAMGHSVWIDQELEGGQQWWDAILDQIALCDLFVFVLSCSSTDAESACLPELDYGVQLDRRILLVEVEPVDLDTLPIELAKRQLTSYVTPSGYDAASLVADVAAVAALGSSPPLPEPKPPRPAVPMSYKRRRYDEVKRIALVVHDQRALVDQLKRDAGDDRRRRDAVELLRQIKDTIDEAAQIGEGIQSFLGTLPRQRRKGS